MLTRDYLSQTGLTTFQLAEILGHKTTSMVTKKLDVDMPKRWERMLDLEDSSSAVGTEPDSEARSHNEPPSEFRQSEENNDPRMPDDGVEVVGPSRIRLDTIEGYITQIYGGAAALCTSRGDHLAAEVINNYSPQFAEAWVDYIRSDPRIMEFLERMMIGTPLGNLIGVHAIAVGSYTFARVAAKQVAAAYESAEVNGANHSTPVDSLA